MPIIESLKSALPPWLAQARVEDLLTAACVLVLVIGLLWLIAQAAVRGAEDYPYDDEL